MANVKVYDVTDWIKNNYNTHITKYLKKNFWHDKKAMVNAKSCDVTGWITNNYNTHITQYLQK